MPKTSQDRPEPGDTLDSVIARYLQLLDQGERFDRDEFLRTHPEHAAGLRRYLENVAFLEELAETDVSKKTNNRSSKGDESHPVPETLNDLRADAETSLKLASSDGDQPDIPEEFGRYRIIRTLGKGAMGTVYEAYDTQLDRNVALKIPRFEAADREEMVQRFRREARAAAGLRHPNICPVFDVGEIDGRHYISMAFLDGFSLKEFARSSTRQPEEQVALTIHKLALALAEAHRQGVVHRDLKSDNVIVDRNGEPIVTDFGLARRVHDDEIELTRAGAILGTPAYMSPEHLEGDPNCIGPASDIYGLGVIFYELLTGQLPFAGPLRSVLKQIVCDTVTPPSELRPGVDPRLESICLKMMARRVEDRYRSMDEVAESLAALLAPTRSRSRSRQWALGGLAIAMVVASLLMFDFRTGDGSLIIEVDDPGFAISVVGEEILVTREQSGQEYRLSPGLRQIEVQHGDLRFVTPQFEIHRGDQVSLSVRLVDGEITVSNGETVLSRETLVEEHRDANREAVATLLAAGAAVQVADASGSPRPIETAADLPAGDWTLSVRVADDVELSDAMILAMAASERIVSLEVHSPIAGENISKLGSVSGLKQLYLFKPGVFSADDLHPISQLQDLTSFVLGGAFPQAVVPESFTDMSATAVSRLTQLRHLQFGAPGAPLTDLGLTELQKLKELEDLKIDGSEFSDSGLAGLLEHAASLRFLRVRSSSPLVHGEFLREVSGSQRLEGLALYCDQLQDRFLQLALGCENLTELQVVYAEQVNGHSLSTIDLLPALKNVTFHKTGLDDEGLEQIARFKSLERLTIRENRNISDEGLQQLTGLERLQRLDVSDNPQVSDAIFDICEHLPSLVYLYTAGTGVTPEGVEQMRRERSGLQIIAAP